MTKLKIGKRILIGGVVLGVVAAGWGYLQYQRRVQAREWAFAFLHFREPDRSEVWQKLKQKNLMSALSAGQQDLIRLKLAGDLVQAHELTKAAAQLKQVLTHSTVDELRTLALTRVVRILVELDQPQEGVVLLERYKDWLPELTYLELRGDLYFAQGQPAEARARYQAAWQLNSEEKGRERLQLKLQAC